MLTRSVSARTVTLAVNSASPPGVTLGNLLSHPNMAVTTTASTLRCRSLTRAASCPTMSSPLHLSPSPSLLRPPRRNPSSGAKCAKTGKGRAQFDGDVDLDAERVTDLPVTAACSADEFPDFVLEPAQLSVADVRLLARVGSLCHRPCRHRAPQLVQIKCLRWLSSLDHGAA